ncbi:unnamed protein product [Nippostrongylus brasiliensis]|uniref:Uncharacterized protein n=1 Tax=Nippostrongylus brasiliensis TaxID=27835 RepID=A0A0N4XND1_NIPBR|nr:unnamed protein product [Nippostrongylus brasiliensis]
MNPTRSSQIYTIIGEFDLGHMFLLLNAFLLDAIEETYLNLSRTQIELLGGVAALDAKQCNIIEMSATNAVCSTLNMNVWVFVSLHLGYSEEQRSPLAA